jgi:N-acyl-L-homoserine lactone synthetase
MQARYRVTLWESERGWGRKPFMDCDFDSYDAAFAKYQEVNAKNRETVVPAYYIFAQEPRLVDTEKEPPL